MIYLNTHPEDLNIDLALKQVSPQRREAALRYMRDIDRKLSLAAFLLLMEGLEKEYGISEPPVLAFGPHGKPFLRDYPHIHFNLSHCSRAALCVVGDAPVGCDVETVTTPWTGTSSTIASTPGNGRPFWRQSGRKWPSARFGPARRPS